MMRPMPGSVNGLLAYMDEVLQGNKTMFDSLVLLHPRVKYRANAWMRATGVPMSSGIQPPNGILTLVCLNCMAITQPPIASS